MGDIKVEAWQKDIAAGASDTLTLSNDVGDLADAFVLNMTPRRTSGGNISSTANANWRDFAASVQLSATDTLTFTRYSGSSGTVRMRGEVWRYVGASGGDHEFKVRWRGTVTIDSADQTADQTISGVVDPDKCVIFVNGVVSYIASTSEGNRNLAAAYLTSSTNVRAERGETGNTVPVEVTVVEFTGSAWTIGHFDTGVIGTANSADATIYPNYDHTGTPVTISDWSTAFIWADMIGDNTGGNHALEDTWFVIEPKDADEVTVDLDDTAVVGSVRGFVLQNDSLSVERESTSKSIPGGSDTSLTDPSNLSTADESSLAEWYVYTDGGGTAYARGAVTAYLNGTAVEAWVHRSGNTGQYRYAGIDLTGLESSGNTYDETGRAFTITTTVASSDTLEMAESPAFTITTTVASSDAQEMVEGPAFTATFTVASTDAQEMVEGPAFTATFTVASTDAREMAEAPAIDATFTVASTDAREMAEAPAIDATFTVASSDAQEMVEGPAFTATFTIDSTDEESGAYNETGRQVDTTFTVAVSDVLSAVESAALTVEATVASTDALAGSEDVSEGVTFTVAAADTQEMVEASTFTATFTVASDDVLQGAAQEYDETGRAFTAAFTIDCADDLAALEAAALESTFTVTGADTLTMVEASAHVATFTVAETDTAAFADSQNITATFTLSSTDARVYAGMLVVEVGQATVAAEIAESVVAELGPVGRSYTAAVTAEATSPESAGRAITIEGG